MSRAPAVGAAERTALQALVGVLGTFAVATGLNAILRGPAGEPGGERINASIDSEFRFAHAYWVAAGAALLWSLRAPAGRAPLARGVLGVAAAGGLARLVSIRREGLPHPIFRGALAVELAVVPPIIVWHRRVFGR